MFVSHPSSYWLLQSPQPDWQLRVQTPELHVGVEFGLVAQAFPHLPQFERSTDTWVSHPQMKKLQFAHPDWQAPTRQTPEEQSPTALSGSHVTSQSPQLVTVFTFRSQPSSVAPG